MKKIIPALALIISPILPSCSSGDEAPDGTEEPGIGFSHVTSYEKIRLMSSWTGDEVPKRFSWSTSSGMEIFDPQSQVAFLFHPISDTGGEFDLTLTAEFSDRTETFTDTVDYPPFSRGESYGMGKAIR